MKKLVFILLVLLVTIAKSQSNSEAVKSPLSDEFWSENDNKMHFFASYAISASTYLFLSKHPKCKNLSPFQKRSIAFSTSVFFGLLKETIDATQKNDIFSKDDLIADLSGAVAFQATIIIPLNFEKKKNSPKPKP